MSSLVGWPKWGMRVCTWLLLGVGLLPVSAAHAAPIGTVIPVNGGYLELDARAPNVVRVAFAKKRTALSEPSFAGLARTGDSSFSSIRQTGQAVDLRTGELRVHVRLGDGRVSFFDTKGKQILAEEARKIERAVVQGENTFHVGQVWASHADESLFGLGQQQLGVVDIKGYDLDLWQRNTNVTVPFLVSSRGYGVFWDNPSFTRFGDLRQPKFVPSNQLVGLDGKPGGLTGTYYAGRDFNRFVGTRQDAKIDFPNPASGDGLQPPVRSSSNPRGNPSIFPNLPPGDASVRWEGFIVPSVSGVHQFHTYSNGGIRLFIDGRLVIDHWRQSWLPEVDVARVAFIAGHRCRIRLEWVKDQGAQTMIFRWKTPSASDATSLWSEVGHKVDYTFVYGPSLDKVVAGYRSITGASTMLPRWAFGLWQSRQRYETQSQSLDVVDGFRSRGIPFDNIVQDWMYWKPNQWGSHEFDPARFPDPVKWINSIHDRHANLMISVWGKFYTGTRNFDEMNARGFLYQPNLTEKLKDWMGFPFTFFDAFNPAARDLFWEQVNRELFSKKVDAWWMDATEPDLLSTPSLEGTRSHLIPTAAGTPSRVLDGYALQIVRGISEGQLRTAPKQRVFILTRSGYAGQQRYGTATWSGDITSTWTAMARQIPAGLGFSVSGPPYWTQDIGGFSVPARFSTRNPKPADVEEWRELNTRWFEFGTFTPLLRVHGEAPFREMWEFGGEASPAYKAMLKFDRLRYRLAPYLYSMAGDATQKGAVLMRPLVMDFPADARARTLTDQYMFGKSLMVSPVTHYLQRVRSLYLPAGDWYDFWTGQAVSHGDVKSAAPFDSIPIHVRAGSILPIGPDIQYMGEKAADPVTLYVYTGADGDFSMYEDDGLTNGYLHGEWARIPIHWSEASQTLTIGRRAGSFPEMLRTRTFKVVFVSKNRPIPFSFEPQVDRVVRYLGAPIAVRFEQVLRRTVQPLGDALGERQ